MRLSVLLLSGCPWIPPEQHFQDQGETRRPEESDPTTVPVDTVCEDYPKADNFDLEAPAEAPFAPSWLGFEWQMFSDEQGFHDFAWTGGEIYASFFQVNAYGPEGNFLCTVRFNVVHAEPAPASVLPPSGEIAAAWFIDSSVGRAPQTDCPPLDPAVFGAGDMVELLSQGSWGFGLGALGEITEGVREDFTEDGADWDEWAPTLLGGYVTYDGKPPVLVSYDVAYDAECGETVNVGGNPVKEPQAPTAPILEATHIGDAFYLEPSTDFLPVTCDRPSSELADDWEAAGTELTTVAYVGLGFDVVPAPEGGLVDYGWDVDGDGIEEPQNALVRISLYDADVVELCSFDFDAERAVELDPGQLSSESGEIYRAWTMELTGGTSDCPGLDSSIYGTEDPRDLFADWSFGFGVGELELNRDAIEDAYTDNWEGIESAVLGVYVTTDGVTAQEVSYGFGFDLDDCLSFDINAYVLPADITISGFTTNLYGLPYIVWPLEYTAP